MQKLDNVTYAKPAVAGAISFAKLGTALPTDAISPLAEGFKKLGYIGEDGIVRTTEKEIEDIKAFGGDTVLKINSGTSASFNFKLLEVLNKDVIEFVYGAENVSGSLEEGIKVRLNQKEVENKVVVIDLILKGGILKRIIIPVASVGDIGDETYIHNDAIGYEITLEALPCAELQGDLVIEYTQKGKGEEVDEG